MVKDVSNVLFETEIDQAISLIQTQILAHVRVELLLIQHVQQSSRRRHDHVQPLLEQSGLLEETHAPDAEHAAQLGEAVLHQVLREVLNDLEGLTSELARRTAATHAHSEATHK